MALLENPVDMAVIAAIVLVAFGVVGIGISGMNEQGIDTGDSAIFTDLGGQVTSPTGLGRTSNSSANVLDPSVNENLGQTTEEGFLFRGLQGLIDISASYKAFEGAMSQLQTRLGIPSIIIYALGSLLIISLFAVIYTWWRGR